MMLLCMSKNFGEGIKYTWTDLKLYGSFAVCRFLCNFASEM